MRCAAIVVAMLALSGCGLARTTPAVEPDVAARAIAQASGIPLRKAPRPLNATTLFNLRASYLGNRGEQSLLVLVFDTRAATGQVLGEPSLASRPFEVLRSRNVVVIYQPDGVGDGTAGAVRSALRRLD